MSYVVNPPQEMILPVTRGCDRAFTLQRVDENGVPINFAAGVTVYLWADINADEPTKIDASVSGSQASFVIDSEVCDQIRHRMKWRIVLDQGELETPLLVGRFARNDG